MKFSSGKITVLLLLCGYAFLSIFSLIHMSHMSMHGMAMADCPYLPLQQLPGNDMSSHLKGWQYFSQIILPLIGLFVFFCSRILSRFSPLKLEQFFVPIHIGFDPPPLWQQLFSQGILHPKAP